MTSLNTRSARRGFAILWYSVVFLVLLGFVALAIDIGRVRLAKTELQTAADAAARAAAWHVRSDRDQARQVALNIAARNLCRGLAVALDPAQDIEFGQWDRATRTFILLQGGALAKADSVRIHTRRLAVRANPIPLIFARVVGLDSVDVQATATGTLTGGWPIRGGIVGIDWVDLKGNPIIDSFDSNLGPYDPLHPGQQADVLSNGDLLGNGQPAIRGDAYPGPGHRVSANIDLSGATIELPEPLIFPSVDAGPYKLANDNANLQPFLDEQGNFTLGANETFHVPAGTYCVRDLTLLGSANLYLDGPVTFYVTGQVNLAGNVNTHDARPGDFAINVEGSGPVKLAGTSDLHASIYAPESDLTAAGTHDFFGAMVGKTLRVLGTGDLHEDHALVQRAPPRVALVQ